MCSLIRPFEMSNTADLGRVIDTFPTGFRDTTTVPDEFKTKFMTLLEDLEKQTGKLYTLEVKELGFKSFVRFKPFDQRTGYSVYDMNPKYTELEGQYKTIQEIENRIKTLQAEALGVKDGTWKCIVCHHQNAFSGGWTYGHCCQSKTCKGQPTSTKRTIWDDITPFPAACKIGKGDDCITWIGHLRVY